jgi:tight adherence protein C
MVLPLLAFVFGSLIITAVALVLMPGKAVAIDRRLEELTLRDEADGEKKPRLQSLIGLIKRVGEKVPRNPKEMGSLRLRLVQSGYRRDEAVTIFFGIRVMFALGLFLFFSTPIVARPNMTMALAGLGAGYVLPGMALARLAKRRAHRIRLALADALDLLVVSVEAGLGLDQAMTRVGSELAFAYPDLSD